MILLGIMGRGHDLGELDQKISPVKFPPLQPAQIYVMLVLEKLLSAT